MIIIRLIGGLGNQFFQYALGHSLAQKTGQELKLDAFAYEGNKADPQAGIRTFGLDHFNISASLATKEDLAVLHRYFRTDWIGKIAKGVNLLKPGPYWSKDYIVEPVKNMRYFDEHLIAGPLKNPVYIRGFWQTPMYFTGCVEEIRRELSVRDPAVGQNAGLLKELDLENSVSVHVRHGDNANQVASEHGVLPLEYYREAANKIAQQVDNPRFYVFSDDPGWAKTNLHLPYKTSFVDWNNDKNNFEDMRLQTACKHHIVGNSTFSWWSAWLGKKAGQIIYAPKCYYVGQDISETDYYPPDWNLL